MSLKNILLRTLNQKNKFVNIASTAVRINHEYQSHRDHWHGDQKQQHNKYKLNIIKPTVLFGAAVLAKTLEDEDDDDDDDDDDDVCKKKFEPGQKKPGLPVYRSEEVSKHDTKDSFWVIYKHGVYDVTTFLPSHPGGEQILNAGGLSVEPFWNVYGMHKTKDIFKLLESYRIGNLHDDDVSDYSNDELWVREPVRSKKLIVKTKKPFNAEIPAKLQVEYFDTPNEYFFVRQHMAVPDLDACEHTLQITIPDTCACSGCCCKRCKNFKHKFTLEELIQMFPPAEVRAALMCAGNRRSEMNKVKPVKGIDWHQGAISNAVWSGVYLRDVLVYCGVDTSNTVGKHVIFTGSDMDAMGNNFNTSIPLEQALNPNGKILLATHMNGEVLPKDHGYPLRVVVPGAPAFRSVKWLESITISCEESPSHWHQRDYRSFNSSKTWETADFPSAPPIYSLPVTSAICDPMDGDICHVEDGHIEVRGYAYSGGGAKIVRVDISTDRGCSWTDAQELIHDSAPATQHYAWTLWTAKIPVSEGQTELEIWAKATDSNFNTQPEKFEDIWNIRGLLGNAYHKIKVQIRH